MNKSKIRLIDKDALLEAMEQEWSTITDIDDFYYLVKNFHTIDMGPRKDGRWEQCFEDWRQQFEGDMCSVCGFKVFGGVSKFNYCPHCGAKMDGEA